MMHARHYRNLPYRIKDIHISAAALAPLPNTYLDRFMDRLIRASEGLASPPNITIDKEIKVWDGRIIIFTDQDDHQTYVLKQINPAEKTWDQFTTVNEYV